MRSWQFALLFAFSAIINTINLIFLKHIPNVPTPQEPNRPATRVPWLKMTRYPPFRKLLRTAVAWSVAYGGMTAFTVAFLKAQSNMAEGTILLVTSTAFLGGLSSF